MTKNQCIGDLLTLKEHAQIQTLGDAIFAVCDAAQKGGMECHIILQCLLTTAVEAALRSRSPKDPVATFAEIEQALSIIKSDSMKL